MTSEGQREILVVEDEERIASVLKAKLELLGYHVQIAGTGKAALTCAAEQQPDLVVLDLKLPDMHGYVVCQELRRRFHPWEVPVLMLTALDQPVDQLRGFAYGADAYLTKPFELTDFAETVVQLLGHATAR